MDVSCAPDVGTAHGHRPEAAGRPASRLNDVLGGSYLGYGPTSAPRQGFVLPAGLAVPLVVKVVDSPLRPPAFVTGPRRAFTTIEGACAPSFVEITLPPLAAYTIIGQPLDGLGGAPLDLGEVVGHDGRRLGERIREAGSWTTRWRLLDAFLGDRVERGPRPSPEVAHAWALVRRSRGREPITRIASTVGWSHKHLIARFRAQIGVVPKSAARLVRFEAARTRGADGIGWGQIASEVGYADQAHLIRDFRQFTGRTPAQR